MAERLARLEAKHTDAPTRPVGDCPECGHPLDDCQCPPPTDAEAQATLAAAFPDATWGTEETVLPNS